ncbi:phosphate ABC transporter permease PstA [Calditerrivibrio nitroreducens]|uniref:Phosphate transport system permease protein PstA n=1 Tax=Calditerrivibrio nitroreducens (strain DSM 19672 / NBRC 101217 / Yu37-1) TaxID=768670 RepID=E4TF42_CALNY|nr:phosphate ABC transporter permease PstA [Calditerrivibrio nitroreducens]ADR19482.1 phosphate ABC transporter, inner membrane subunit PstA [Calditerrivibrio nitroreducens DSM 19672]
MNKFARKNFKIFFKSKGEPMLWLTGGGLVISLLMIILLMLLVLKNGLGNYWPEKIVYIKLKNGGSIMGEITKTDYYKLPDDKLNGLNDEDKKRLIENNGKEKRFLVRVGNFELSNKHFEWVSLHEISEQSYPAEAMVLERLEWGRFYGFPKEFLAEGKPIAKDLKGILENYAKYHDEMRKLWRKKVSIEKGEIGKLNHKIEKERLKLKEAKFELDNARLSKDSKKINEAEERYKKISLEFEEFNKLSKEEYERLIGQIDKLKSQYEKYGIKFLTADGKEKEVKLYEIVRGYTANTLNFGNKMGIYFSRWFEFLTDEPREANSEGGVFPAIFGTVVMTVLMSLFVVPFGVVAAIYMKEYAKSGKMISILRIAINNLAGVPSIVYGVFGLGFFAYTLGATIDQLFYSAKLPNPTFGTGGILWSSLTLALLTLPVVIVATEEAINAVPNSLREGSYACGATKWQTVRYIVLPRAMPGIMTGFILAMSRGAGEVAPLMLVGAVKLAPEMPVDSIYPFVHLERSFMHLGFHIYDLGFQSQNSDAAIPMVYTTTLLLISIVILLNVVAIYIRNKLRKKFIGSVF